ncbi:MAG: hypothetical protein OHK0029_36900 [Armatimonadaceae bacterium]
MALHDMGTKIPVRSFLIALVAYLLRNIQHNRHRHGMVAERQLQQGFPRSLLNIRRIYNRQFTTFQAQRRQVVQGIKGITGGFLIGFIIGDHCPKMIRR